MVIFADEGSADVSAALSNANVGVSESILSNLAVVPSVPSSPCLATCKDIVLLNEVDAEVAVTTIEPLNGAVAFVIVTVSPDNVVVM